MAGIIPIQLVIGVVVAVGVLGVVALVLRDAVRRRSHDKHHGDPPSDDATSS